MTEASKGKPNALLNCPVDNKTLLSEGVPLWVFIFFSQRHILTIVFTQSVAPLRSNFVCFDRGIFYNYY